MHMRSEEISEPSGERNQSLRLTFSYRGSHVKLVKLETVRTISPQSDPTYYDRNQTGFWYELQDDEGRTLYRRIISNPIESHEEVLLGNEERSTDGKRLFSFSRQRIDKPRGIFVLLPPNIREARYIVLFGSPLERGATGRPAEEIGRFNLALESQKTSEK